MVRRKPRFVKAEGFAVSGSWQRAGNPDCGIRGRFVPPPAEGGRRRRAMGCMPEADQTLPAEAFAVIRSVIVCIGILQRPSRRTIRARPRSGKESLSAWRTHRHPTRIRQASPSPQDVPGNVGYTLASIPSKTALVSLENPVFTQCH